MNNKTCLITGASSGIGKYLSMELAKYGAKIIIVCRDEEKGNQARKEIIEITHNNEVDLFIIDLSSQQSIHQGIKKIKEKCNHIDVLINNAGVLLFKEELTDEGIERTLATNLCL